MKSVGHAVALGISLLVACNGLQSSWDLPHVEGYVSIMPSSDMAVHKVALWRQKTDSYVKNSFKSPTTGVASFNSCMDKDVTAQNVCSSHGICKPFDKTNIVHPAFFCKCDLGWAGSECTIPQKSQTTAWCLSLLFGWTGVDEYYLGWYFPAAMKLLGLFLGCVIGLLGANQGSTGFMTYWFVMIYWFYDIVRIGSGQVRASEAKVAADLPHWAFSCFTLLFFTFLAFGMGVCKIYWNIKTKRRRADIETNYNACDQYGLEDKNVKLNKFYDHHHVFGFPAYGSIGASYAALPIHTDR